MLKKISLVFGCGGDRDKNKRSLMAKVANKYSKKIYVTDDNPRNEDPKKIRNEIVKKINISKCFNINMGFGCQLNCSIPTCVCTT